MTARDIVRDVLERLMAHDDSITAELALRVEVEIRREWGGQRVFVGKTVGQRVGRPPSLSPEALRKAYADGLSSEPVSAVTKRHGISRSSLYTLVKKGPPPVKV